MKKLIMAGVLATAFLAVPATAQSVFDGTWKTDVSKIQMPKKPDVLLLQGGIYECKTCVPAIKVKADGTDQKVAGMPYSDMVAIKVVDDHTIQETDKKNGKVVSTSTTTVAADGKTAKFEFSDSSNTNAAPVTGKGTMTRVAAGPKGAHAISGSWITASMDSFSSNGLTITYKVKGNTLSMTAPTGQTYTAMTDGMDAPYKGDAGITSVSVTMPDKNTLVETDKRNGKPIGVATMKVSADGKTMSATYVDKLQGKTYSFVSTKQ